MYAPFATKLSVSIRIRFFKLYAAFQAILLPMRFSMLSQVGREHMFNGLLCFPPQLHKQNMAGASALAYRQSKVLDCTARVLG